MELATGVDVGELSSLDDRVLVECVQQARALARRASLAEALLVGEVERRGLHLADGHRSVRAWLRALTRCSDRTARLVQRRARLLKDLPQLAEAAGSGRVGVDQLDELARARANPRCGAELGAAGTLLSDLAATLPFEAFRRCVHRWEALADTDGAHDANAASVDRRDARMARVGWTTVLQAELGGLAAAEIQEIFERFVDAERRTDLAWVRDTRGGDGDRPAMPRTEAQRRADALHQIFLAAAGAPTDGVRPEPSVSIVCDLATFEEHLTRATGHPAARGVPLTGRRFETRDGNLVHPGEVLTAALLGHVRRVVLDGAGVVVDLGRRRRLFEGPVRDAVLLQAARCVWPGCDIPTSGCEADHIHPWEARGPTVPSNGAPLCNHHNRFKHRRGYRVHRHPDGTWHTYRPDGTTVG